MAQAEFAGETRVALLVSAHRLEDELALAKHELAWTRRLLSIGIALSSISAIFSIYSEVLPLIFAQLNSYTEFAPEFAVVSVFLTICLCFQYVRFDIDRFGLEITSQRLKSALSKIEAKDEAAAEMTPVGDGIPY